MLSTFRRVHIDYAKLLLVCSVKLYWGRPPFFRSSLRQHLCRHLKSSKFNFQAECNGFEREGGNLKTKILCKGLCKFSRYIYTFWEWSMSLWGTEHITLCFCGFFYELQTLVDSFAMEKNDFVKMFNMFNCQPHVFHAKSVKTAWWFRWFRKKTTQCVPRNCKKFLVHGVLVRYGFSLPVFLSHVAPKL